MTQDDKYNKKINTHHSDWQSEDDDTQQGGGQDDSGEGGKSGQVEFRDFLSNTDGRDDLLSADERKRLLLIHKDSHEIRVKKQKGLRDQRNDLKDGKVPLQAYHQGLHAGMNSEYKINPVLADKAQFNGIDRQVNPLSTENVAETNEADRNELENQYRKRYAPEQAPRFNPKPEYNR